MTFNVRVKCNAENGDGKGWHYHRDNQEEVDDTMVCPLHPTAEVEGFTIEKEIT